MEGERQKIAAPSHEIEKYRLGKLSSGYYQKIQKRHFAVEYIKMEAVQDEKCGMG